MSFNNEIVDFLLQTTTSISKLFNVKENKDFLHRFVSRREINNFLRAGESNCDHVKEMITFIQEDEHEHLYNALIDQILVIHAENEEFVKAMMRVCGRQLVRNTDTTTTVIVDENNDQMKRKQDKEIMNFIKEIMIDMRSLCCESEKLQQTDKLQQEMKNIETLNRILKNEVEKLKPEMKQLRKNRSENSFNSTFETVDAQQLQPQNDKKADEKSESINKASERVTSMEKENKQLRPDDSLKVAESLFKEGDTYRQSGKYKEALDCYTSALEMYQRLYEGDHVDIAETLNWIGNAHFNLDEQNNALEFFTQALEMYQRLYEGDNKGIAYTLNYIGWCHKKQGNYSQALEIYTKSHEMYKRLKNDWWVNFTASAIEEIVEKMKK